MARQFQTPVSWGMGGNGSLSSSYLDIGGFGQPKELSGVVIGDSTPPTGYEAYKRILVEDVDADKMTGILFYPKAWTVSLSEIFSVTDLDYGGDTASGSFTASASGKFGRLGVGSGAATIWSTNKQPGEVLTKYQVFDVKTSEGTYYHQGNLSNFYGIQIQRFGSGSIVDETITCEDVFGSESGRAIYTSTTSSSISSGNPPSPSGDIVIHVEKIYYKPNGKCDVIVMLEANLSAGSVWYVFGSNTWDGGIFNRPLTGETLTATILGKSVTLYVYSDATTGTLSLDLNFDVVQTEAWDFSTP